MREPILPISNLDDQLIRDEGWKNEAYPDPLTGGNPWTIGVGHTGPEVYEGLIWSDQRIQTVLNSDINATEKAMIYAFPWALTLDPIRRSALHNMVFNMGVYRVSQFKKMIRALSLGHFNDAADEALDSKWAKQVGGRAQRLAKQIRIGEWQ